MEVKEFKVKNAYPDNREWLDDFQLYEKIVSYKGVDIAIISLLYDQKPYEFEVYSMPNKFVKPKWERAFKDRTFKTIKDAKEAVKSEFEAMFIENCQKELVSDV